MSNPQKEIISNDEYTALAEEVKSIFTERIYNAREEIITAHWETGKLMSEFILEHKCDAILLVKRMVEIGAARQTTLYESLKFYETYPKLNDIDKLGHGKNISWNKIRMALSTPKEDNVNKEEVECNHLCKKHCKIHCK